MMGAMGGVLLSSVPRMLVNAGKDTVKKTINQAIRMNLFIAAPITMGLIGIADVVVPWFLGTGYKFIRHGKKRNVAVAAIARELACFVWGMMIDNIEMKAE